MLSREDPSLLHVVWPGTQHILGTLAVDQMRPLQAPDHRRVEGEVMELPAWRRGLGLSVPKDQQTGAYSSPGKQQRGQASPHPNHSLTPTEHLSPRLGHPALARPVLSWMLESTGRKT